MWPGKDAWTASNGVPQCAEIAASFWRQEQDCLLSFGRYGYKDALGTRFLGPGFDPCEPVSGWGVGYPRRNATTRTYLADCVLGRSG